VITNISVISVKFFRRAKIVGFFRLLGQYLFLEFCIHYHYLKQHIGFISEVSVGCCGDISSTQVFLISFQKM